MKPEFAWGIATLGALVVVAALVNALAPTQRKQLRRIVILYALYAVCLGASYLFVAIGLESGIKGFAVAADILKWWVLVSLAGTLAFVVILPRVRVATPIIVRDLVVLVGYVATTLAVLSMNGLNPQGALVSGAVVSAVLAISLQSTLGNLLGGVALQIDGSVHEGDWIQLENGKQGRVRAVRWRHTVIETRDWSTIVVPNSVLLQGSITLLGKRDGKEVPQRLWVWFNVDFRYSPTRVIDVVTECLSQPIENVADDPKPNVVCMDFSKDGKESFATYAVRYWIKDLASDDPTNTRVRARVYTALHRAKIPLAIPAHTTLFENKDARWKTSRHAEHLAERIAALRTVSLFKPFSDEELTTLAEGMSHVIYGKGEIVTRQGAVAHWLYVMTSGKVEIRVRHDPDGPGPGAEHNLSVATIEAPGFFGEMGLMTGEPRAADVVAASDVVCFRLGKETFEKVLLGRPDVVEELSATLAARRVQLLAVREGLDLDSMRQREESERARILKGIKGFFGL
ncbi:MAG: mechanosensitive ion channel family protein [Polyangiaceae bacterium]